MNRTSLGLGTGALALSSLLHGVAYATLPGSSRGTDPWREPAQVEFEVTAPKKLVETPLPAPSPPTPEAARPAQPPAPLATPPPSQPAAAPPGPVDLRGVTLTNDGEGDATSPIGDGSSLRGPLHNPRPAPALATLPPAPSAPAPTLPEPPHAVPLSDLSARPVPPSLDGALRQHYPAEAERQGVGGEARVQARIEPDGRVKILGVLAESFPGFGAACRKTLADSRWTPPRDRSGRAVATEIRYTCRFVVGR